MAEQNNAAANAVANIYRTPELWEKITFTFLCMVIYRIGSHITAPGIDVQALTDYFTRQQGGGLLGLYDMFVGGGLSRALRPARRVSRTGRRCRDGGRHVGPPRHVRWSPALQAGGPAHKLRGATSDPP